MDQTKVLWILQDCQLYMKHLKDATLLYLKGFVEVGHVRKNRYIPNYSRLELPLQDQTWQR